MAERGLLGMSIHVYHSYHLGHFMGFRNVPEARQRPAVHKHTQPTVSFGAYSPDGFSCSALQERSQTGSHSLTFRLKFLPSIHAEHSDPVLISRCCSQGVWGGQVHTAVFKTDNQQGPAVARGPCPVLSGSLGGRGVWGTVGPCICMAESLTAHLKLLQHCLVNQLHPNTR